LHQLDWQASGIAALVLSPGISPRRETVQAATRAGIPLLNDAILFASCNTPARVIGVYRHQRQIDHHRPDSPFVATGGQR
jgi:UDP-N-acetylmuramoylalanine-D-glutamate ligase